MKMQLAVTPELIDKYDLTGPRYTSYPTALQFTPEFKVNDYLYSIQDSNEDLVPHALSLYVHIPFCENICFYCACNKIVTRDHKKAEKYLDYLNREIALKGKMFDRDRKVEQLHFGGGTPTYYTPQQLKQILDQLSRYFDISKNEQRDYSIEVDPRTVEADTLGEIKKLGFNRISFGVQDLNPQVQHLVNRSHSKTQIDVLVSAARDAGFISINIDLMYGLPKQTVGGFSDTLNAIADIRPDRISIFNYAHLPQRFRAQRRIEAVDLPAAEKKLEIYTVAVERLVASGYVFIGMDHFALPEDELAQAKKQNKLYRNFQGYTLHGNCDLVAFGVSAIGFMDECYVQNYHELKKYYAAVDACALPISRGVLLTADDLIRRDVIMRLLCQFNVEFKALYNSYNIDFNQYFADVVPSLQIMQQDGLLVLNATSLSVTDTGKFLIRSICKLFDRYSKDTASTSFSKVI